MAFVLEISQKNGKLFRMWKAVNAVLWIVYDLVTLSFGPLSTHAIQLGNTVAGMILHDKKKNVA